MTQKTNIITLRLSKPLTFTVTPRQLIEIYQSEKFRDVVAVGKLLNAIRYAHERGFCHQIAKFGLKKTLTTETVCLTGGLLHKALSLISILINRYKDQPYVKEMEEMVTTNEDYYVPEVLFEITSNGPFRIGTKPKASVLLKELGLNGKDELLREVEIGEKGFAIATIVDPYEYWTDRKRGKEPEVHQTMEDVVDYYVDEFTLAAEQFIFNVAQELGLSSATEPPAEQLKLAA